MYSSQRRRTEHILVKSLNFFTTFEYLGTRGSCVCSRPEHFQGWRWAVGRSVCSSEVWTPLSSLLPHWRLGSLSCVYPPRPLPYQVTLGARGCSPWCLSLFYIYIVRAPAQTCPVNANTVVW